MKRRMAREVYAEEKRAMLNDRPDTDLHIHTRNSDGTLTPAEVVQWAEEKGLRLISVTDHDVISGLAEAAAAAKKAGISFVNGVEMSTEFHAEGRYAEKDAEKDTDPPELHILGYGFDPGDMEIRRVCDIMRESRAERNEKLLAAIAAEGYDITKDDIPRAEAGYISKPQIARAMIEKGYVGTVGEAFERVFDTPRFRAIKKEKTDAAEAVRIITGAGGTAVLAHPMRIRNIGKRGTEEMYMNLEKIVIELAAHGMGGLECCYSAYTEEETARLREMAERHGLISTRGSDFHGPGVTAD